ncbi:unnamed protein product [Larinioides sclopetarius]
MYLARGGNPNHRDQFQDTLLHLVAKFDYCLEIVVELAKAGANVNSENFLRQTPLHIAVIHRNLRMVNALLNFGAFVNTQDCRGNSVLHSAINACVSKDQDWNCDNPYCPHRAPDMNIIWRLLRHKGINVNIRNLQGHTPLLWAVKDKNLEIVTALLLKSANVHIGNYFHETPMHAALSHSNPDIDIVGELLRRGGSIACFDKNRETPLDRVLKREEVAESNTFLEELVKVVAFYEKFTDINFLAPRVNVKLRKLLEKCIMEKNMMRREIIGDKSLYDVVIQHMNDTTSAPLEHKIANDILNILGTGVYSIYFDTISKYIFNFAT